MDKTLLQLTVLWEERIARIIGGGVDLLTSWRRVSYRELQKKRNLPAAGEQNLLGRTSRSLAEPLWCTFTGCSRVELLSGGRCDYFWSRGTNTFTGQPLASQYALVCLSPSLCYNLLGQTFPHQHLGSSLPLVPRPLPIILSRKTIARENVMEAREKVQV